MTQQLNERFQLNFKEQPDTITLRRESHDASYACDDKGKLIALNIRNQESLKEVVIPKEWTTLEYLNLSDNKNLKTLEFSTSLPDLFHIDLSDSGLEKVAIPNGFDALKNLDISRNGLKNIDFQGDLPALEMFDLSGNELVEVKLPHSVPALKYLYLNKNRISHLDFEAIPQLEILHLRNNNLTALPANFIRLRNNLQTLYLHGNSLEDIPETILGHGENHNSCEDVVNYCYSEYKSVLQPLYQAKMVLIGNGEVGKTSIRLRLLDEKAPLPKKEERTPGLEIETYTIKNLEPKITQLPTPIDFDFHIWDFGGQGHYREVQQLFCGSKTLYLFVTSHDDTREIEQKEDYVGFEYWMSMVNAYSYDDNDDWVSPVIFVVNKIDQAPKAVNQADCQNLFKNVVEFVSISAETLENFDLLKNKIRSILPKVNHRIFTDKFSQFWLNVKSDLEKKRYRNHITFKQYLKICERNELVESEARSWIRVLDRIGTVIYFGENPKLRDWIILNPIWLKDVIYQVLDSPFVKRGILAASDFQHIWKDKTQEEQTHITALMEAYRLCYPTTDKFGETQYVIPTLLSKKQPNLPADLQQPDFEIKLVFDPFLPAGTVNKLMVSLHDAIYNELRWKNHFILEDRQNRSYAHVWEDWENKTVFIALFGKDVQTLFQKMISEMQQINDALKDTRFMNKLDFDIFAKKGTTWRALEALKEDDVAQFRFLWEERAIIESKKVNMEQIKKLIGRGKVNDALKAMTNKGDKNAQTMLFSLKERWNTLKNKEMMNIVSSSEAGIERNKIVMALLNLINQIEEEELAISPPEEEGNNQGKDNQVDNNTEESERGGRPPKEYKKELSNIIEVPLKSETRNLIDFASLTSETKIKILFLSASPMREGQLNTGRESRFKDLIRYFDDENRFVLIEEHGVTADDFQNFLVKEDPHIVHYGGHGETEGIVLEDENLDGEILAEILENSENTQCVILNACYSLPIAKILAEHIPYVIGTQGAIPDETAIAFARGFYMGIVAGRSVDKAFKNGITTIKRKKLRGANIPILIKGSH